MVCFHSSLAECMEPQSCGPGDWSCASCHLHLHFPGALGPITMSRPYLFGVPADPQDPSWSGTGDRHLLSLFRTFVFHQTSEEGGPQLDWGHVVETLNKVRTGSQTPKDKGCAVSCRTFSLAESPISRSNLLGRNLMLLADVDSYQTYILVVTFANNTHLLASASHAHAAASCPGSWVQLWCL